MSHTCSVYVLVVAPLRLRHLLFYISWLVTVVMHWLYGEPPPLLFLPNSSLTPWLLLRLSHFWWGGLKTQPIRARLTESNTDVTVSLIERKEEGRTAVSCVTMGLCLIPLGWINGIYLIDGSMTTTTQADQLVCKWSRLSRVYWVKWVIYYQFSKFCQQCQSKIHKLRSIEEAG